MGSELILKPHELNLALQGRALIEEMTQAREEIISAMKAALERKNIELEQRVAELEQERSNIANQEKSDTSENVPLQIARENASRLQLEIVSLQNSIEAYARIGALDNTGIMENSVCTIGSVVALVDVNRNVGWIIRLYPIGLGNAKIGAISIDTPLGKALFSHRRGDVVICNAPSGDIKYEIKEVI